MGLTMNATTQTQAQLLASDIDAATRSAAHVPHTPVLEALSRGASAIRSRSRTDMRSARLALDAQLDRRLYGSERHRLVRMLQGIERRLARA